MLNVAQITIAITPADVVKACDVTYSMLSTVEASISVVSKCVKYCSILCPAILFFTDVKTQCAACTVYLADYKLFLLLQFDEPETGVIAGVSSGN